MFSCLETRLEARVVIHIVSALRAACYLNMMFYTSTRSIGDRAMEWGITATEPPSRTD